MAARFWYEPQYPPGGRPPVPTSYHVFDRREVSGSREAIAITTDRDIAEKIVDALNASAA